MFKHKNDDRSRKKRQKNEKEEEEEEDDKDFVATFEKEYLSSSRRKTDQILPSLETDWKIKLDFEEDLKKLDDEDAKEAEEFLRSNPTFRKNREVCTKWLHGLCIFADFQCPQLHIYDPKLFPICRFFIKDKSCTNPDCIFRHPGRQEEVICVEYARGFCKDGPKCDFTHRKYDEEYRDQIRQFVDEALQSHRNNKRMAEIAMHERSDDSQQLNKRRRK